MNGTEFLPIGIELGSGVGLGAVVGYATKKLIKVAVVLVGLFVGVLKLLEAKGVIKIVGEEKLLSLTPDVPAGGQQAADGLIAQLTGVLPFTGGFAAGFLIGLKKG